MPDGGAQTARRCSREPNAAQPTPTSPGWPACSQQPDALDLRSLPRPRSRRWRLPTCHKLSEPMKQPAAARRHEMPQPARMKNDSDSFLFCRYNKKSAELYSLILARRLQCSAVAAQPQCIGSPFSSTTCRSIRDGTWTGYAELDTRIRVRGVAGYRVHPPLGPGPS